MANSAQTPATGLTPHIAIPDKRGSEAIDFYAKAFGATENMRMPAEDGVRLMHAHLHINGSSLMMHDHFPEYSGQAMAAPSGVNEAMISTMCGMTHHPTKHPAKKSGIAAATKPMV